MRLARQVKAVLLAAMISIGLHPGLWGAAFDGYPEDSLHTLSAPQAIGLILLSAVMALFLMSFCIYKNLLIEDYLQEKLTLRLLNSVHATGIVLLSGAGSLLLAILGILLAPQAHYAYYRTLFDGLPTQWVIPGELSQAQLWIWFTLPQEASIAQHANGLVVWICVLSTLFSDMRFLRKLANAA